VAPGPPTVYVTDFADAMVSVIDGSTHTVTTTVPVGDSPDAVAVDPGTHIVYVTNYASRAVSVIKAR
jgi:YVTN family beta-propeller protein